MVNVPLNQSVIFLKQGDLVLTSDTWTVLIQYDLNPYDEALAVLHEELNEIHNVTRPSLQFEEVQRIQLVLQSLENQLISLKQFLPRPGRKRGLLDLGGNLLQLLFGTATVADLNGLHAAVNTLSKDQERIIHSVNQQVTLFKQLDGAIHHNQNTLTNLTAIVKDYVLKVQDKFQNTVSRLEWLAKQQKANAAVRSLEFSVMQLEIQVEELLGAFQALMQGKLPIDLLSFAQLHAILKNVTLTLPTGFELILGSHYSKVPWYYSNAKASMLTDPHSFILMIKLPLITGDRKFEVLRTYALPMKVTNGTYVTLKVDNGYLAVNGYHQTYFTLTDFEFSQCTGDNIKVCEVNKPIRHKDNELNECEYHMYLYADVSNSRCTRLISVVTPDPVLQRHGAEVLYYLPDPTPVFVRCRDNQRWTTNSIILEGAGLLKDTLACHVTAKDLQLYAQMSGETRVQTQPHPIIKHQTITTRDEMQTLKDIISEPDTYNLLSKLSVQKTGPSVEDLITLHSDFTTPANYPNGIVTNIMASTTVTICLLTLYHCSLTLWNKYRNCTARQKSEELGKGTTSKADAPVQRQAQPRASKPTPIQEEAEGTGSPQAATQHMVYAFHGSTSQ